MSELIVGCCRGCIRAGAQPKLLFTIGSKGDRDGQFGHSCFDVACSIDGKVLVPNKRTMQVFSAEGKFLHHIAKGEWQDATGVACAPNGDAFITDYAANCVVVVRSDGSIARRFGSDHLKGGWYVALDHKQKLVYVSDNGNERVQVFTFDGNFVRSLGPKGSGDGQFSSPRGIAVSAAGEVAVADCGNQRIQVWCLAID